MKRFTLIDLRFDRSLNLSEEYVKWSEVEALLLQRAQEIEVLKWKEWQARDHLVRQRALDFSEGYRAGYDDGLEGNASDSDTAWDRSNASQQLREAAEAAPLPASAALQGLIAKWRERAASYRRSADGSEAGNDIKTWNVFDSMCADRSECAGELEAELQGIAIPHQDEEP